MTEFDVVVARDGCLSSIYCESIDFKALGRTQIRRASNVEPTEDGQWLADLSPVEGPLLGPFENRSQAIAAEVRWLRDHWFAAKHPSHREPSGS